MLSRREFCKTVGVVAASYGAYHAVCTQTADSSPFLHSVKTDAVTLCKIPFGEWLENVGMCTPLQQGYYVRYKLKSFESKGITLVISKDELSCSKTKATLCQIITAEAAQLGIPLLLESDITQKFAQCFSESVSPLTGVWCNAKHEKVGEIKGIAFGNAEHEVNGYVVSDESLCTWTLYLRQPTGEKILANSAINSPEQACRELRLDIARLLDWSNRATA